MNTQQGHRLPRRTFLVRAGATSLGLGSAGATAGALLSAAQAASQGASGAVTGRFGWADDGANFVVDTGAQLVFKVSKSNGDLVSLVYRGTEYQGYGGRNSQVETGLGASSVRIGKTPGAILVTVVHGTMHHYYAARPGENNVYLWTNKADASITATRYIVRVRPGLFPCDNPDSWDSRTDVLIEAQDVRRKPDGTTRSKHYSNQRVIDYDHVGWSTGAVGLWMVRSNHEKASGGPFYRSLMRHHYEDGAGLYEILYYGENQTEPMRFGLQGPYVLAFTDGGAPAATLAHDRIDTGWVDGLGLVGWVGDKGRGRVAGVGISGRAPGHAYTVGFANTQAQYWATADPATGAFSCVRMLPGSYAVTVYKGELAVHSGSVTVRAGQTTGLHTIALSGGPSGDPSSTRALWRIGDWDGTPLGFKNAALMTHMHPSDARAAAWTGDFTVGSTPVASFPAYQWRDVNDGLQVRFTLTAAQAAQAHVLRIGITTAYANGRPQIRVNRWTSPVLPAATEPSTRSLTVGSYRGSNHMFSWTVPANAFTAGVNVLRINVVSGMSGARFLSPGFAYDCVELLA
ncbi:rhamnogalacturonan endolyase [Streptacidiphilus sp. MAP12-20]|uniref:rhamnogalacturonan lyase B N-terminal domain-containing protein n=1 Tax=Streptacidiphilus sp. MAP12-20 TaxID=3156299 RepID=UPI0035138AE9